MTFYEAALRVLEAAGQPLHFQEITEKSIQENFLSHVGKTPELTMLSRLLAMARRKADRKLVVTTKDTFALAEWDLPEAPDALAQTAASEIREEDHLPPLRPAERHPEPRADNVRVAGRGAERKRWREEEEGKRKKKKFPPTPEVVFEILSDETGPLKATALIERARERELASADLTEQLLLTALLEDNQRRIDAGRRPQFRFDKETEELALESAAAPSEIDPVELQAAFAAALGIPMEGGRPVLPRAADAAAETPAEIAQAQATLKSAARDAKRATARALRRRLSELDAGTFEKAVVKVLQALGWRELKVAKRSKEGPLLTARKREGSLELRYAIRLLKGNVGADRRMVQELRRDVGNFSAQVALLITAGDAKGDAKAESTSGGALVFLWCGDALGDKFLEAHAGVTVTTIESYELDDRFFEAARVGADESQRRREERQKEKKERPPQREKARVREAPSGKLGEAGPEIEAQPEDEAPEVKIPEEGTAEAKVPAHQPRGVREESEAEDELEGEAEGDGEEELEEAGSDVAGGRAEEGGAAAQGQPGAGEKRRRRRRRRGRRGRGQRPPEAGGAAAPGAEGTPQAAAAGNGGPAQSPPPLPAAGSGDSGEGSAE